MRARSYTDEQSSSPSVSSKEYLIFQPLTLYMPQYLCEQPAVVANDWEIGMNKTSKVVGVFHTSW